MQMKLARATFVSLLLWAPAPLYAAEVTVFAAASLTDAVTEAASRHEKASGDEIFVNFAASSTLARQIQEGAPADLFLSADEEKMTGLEKAGLLRPGTRATVLSNTLVIVVASDSSIAIRAPQDLASPAVRKIALADPRSVPAGIYAESYLRSLGLWTRVESRVIPTENVRAALAAVESGNADTGIVYKTDALISRKVRIAYDVPPARGPRISYPFAALRGGRSPEASLAFLAFLKSPEGLAIFRRYGFRTPAPP